MAAGILFGMGRCSRSTPGGFAANKGSTQRLRRVLATWRLFQRPAVWLGGYLLVTACPMPKVYGKVVSCALPIAYSRKEVTLSGSWKAMPTMLIQTLLFETSVPNTWAPGFLSCLT